MSAKMFWAHALKGFTDTFAEGIKERQERMEELLDNGFDTAKRIAPSYMKTQGQFKQIKEIQAAMQRDFGLTDDEFVALVDATDVTSLYKDVYETKQYREANQLGGLDKSEILSILSKPDDFKLPEGMTADAAIKQILGLQTTALQQENKPKSEGAKQRSFAKAAKELFMLDPRMSAEQQLKNMQYMGVNVNDLIAYQSLAGERQDIFPEISRATEYSVTKDDYTAADIARTQNYAAKTMSLAITEYDLNDGVQFADYADTNTDAGAIKKSINDAASAMSSLERQIIMAGRGNEMFSGRVGRLQIMDQLSRDVATKEEAMSLTNSIKSNFAIGVIKDAIAENRELTDEEIDAIIAGEKPKLPPRKEETRTIDMTGAPGFRATDDLESTSLPESGPVSQDEIAAALPETVSSNIEVVTEIAALPEEKQEEVIEQINNAPESVQSEVARMIIEQAKTPAMEEAPSIDIQSAVEQINEVQEGTGSVEEKADKTVEILLEKANIIAPTNEEELQYFKDDLDEAIADYGLSIPAQVKDEIITRAENFQITRPDFEVEAAPTIERDTITIEEWRGMSRPERRDLGLPESVTGIQQITRGGIIELPEGVSRPPEMGDAPAPDMPQPELPKTDMEKAQLALRLFNDLNENIPEISREFVDEEVIKDYLKQEGIDEDAELIQMILKQIPAE